MQFSRISGPLGLVYGFLPKVSAPPNTAASPSSVLRDCVASCRYEQSLMMCPLTRHWKYLPSARSCTLSASVSLPRLSSRSSESSSDSVSSSDSSSQIESLDSSLLLSSESSSDSDSSCDSSSRLESLDFSLMSSCR